jgi:hypothetical protein
MSELRTALEMLYREVEAAGDFDLSGAACQAARKALASPVSAAPQSFPKNLGAHWGRDGEPASVYLQSAAPMAGVEPVACRCSVCEPQGDGFKIGMRMILCQKCGNKRCPHATHHIFACTNSNESGQLGSNYGVPYVAAPIPPQAVESAAPSLHNRIAELSEQHGSLRAAAAVLQCDPGYLSRLASGEKTDPGGNLLERMGLRQIVTYERIES